MRYMRTLILFSFCPTRWAMRLQMTYTPFVRVEVVLEVAQRVHFLHGVPDADLQALYRMADVFVYPSRYEGFGIPVIEAIHSGLPVVAATGSCLEEAGGPGCL